MEKIPLYNESSQPGMQKADPAAGPAMRTDREDAAAPNDWRSYSLDQGHSRSAKVTISFPVEKDSATSTAQATDKPRQGNDGNTTPESTGSGKEELIFCGVVRGANKKALKGAAVLVAACYKNGTEQPLDFTFTDEEGNYSVILTDLPDLMGLDGFKVKACGTSRTTSTIQSYRENQEERLPSSPPVKNYQSFLNLIYNNPNKTIYELMKGLY